MDRDRLKGFLVSTGIIAAGFFLIIFIMSLKLAVRITMYVAGTIIAVLLIGIIMLYMRDLFNRTKKNR